MAIDITQMSVRSILDLLYSIQVLIVLDGQYPRQASFGPGDSDDNYFGLSEVIRTLNDRSKPNLANFAVTKAHRDTDPGDFTTMSPQDRKLLQPDYQNFKFTDIDLKQFDEIWLIGAGGVGSSGETQTANDLTEDELKALTDFMQGGGGIFATGDHAALGSPMAQRVPRVRSMRKWYWPNPGPNGEPISPPPFGPDRLDTTQPGHDKKFIFDDQSDDIPQPLELKYYIAERGALHSKFYPHPLLCGPHGPITVLPDHMHEGEVIEPWDLTFSQTIKGKKYVEYPKDKKGNRVKPEIIAWGKVLSHGTPSTESEHTGDTDVTSPRTFGVIGAYDGRTLGIGRVVVDSTWHHFFDINLTGDPVAPPGDPKRQGFNATAEGQAVLADIKAYYRNIGMWLARPETIQRVLAGAAWWVRHTHPLNEIVPYSESVVDLLHVGAVAYNALGRIAPQCMLVVFFIPHFEQVNPRIVPPDPWDHPGPEIYQTDFQEAISYALGGAVIEIARRLDHAQFRSQRDAIAQVQKATEEGFTRGLRALTAIVDQRCGRKRVEA